jgi:hypothetical protein
LEIWRLLLELEEEEEEVDEKKRGWRSSSK